MNFCCSISLNETSFLHSQISNNKNRFDISENCQESENCLKLIQEKKTWFKARSHCIDLGGDLFYLNRNETLFSPLLTNNPVYQTIKELSGQVFIGFRHRQWKWNSTSCFAMVVLFTANCNEIFNINIANNC